MGALLSSPHEGTLADFHVSTSELEKQGSGVCHTAAGIMLTDQTFTRHVVSAQLQQSDTKPRRPLPPGDSKSENTGTSVTSRAPLCLKLEDPATGG